MLNVELPKASRQAEDAEHLATEHRVAAQELEAQRTHGAEFSWAPESPLRSGQVW
jgi:hypothetical protein